tara:strand:+ start:7375 stop:7518 length:144 start_codon:yes stop_codon:yes gene_type:complete
MADEVPDDTQAQAAIKLSDDEKIIKALREKISMSDAINGDNYREWLI